MDSEYDVIVAGASNAGGFAAAAAAEKGAKVLLIDKQKDASHLYRFWIGGVNSKAQTKAGIHIDKDQLRQFLIAFTQGNCDQTLINTWIDNSGESADWLEDKILKPHGDHLYAVKDAHYETLQNMAFPTEQHPSKDDKSDDWNYGQYILDFVKDHGGDIKYSTKLEHLITNEYGNVIGAELKDMTTGITSKVKAKKGVILATGGYGNNKALLQKWNPTILEKCCWTQSPRDDGSGQEAALEIGAARDEEGASIIFDRGQVPVDTNINEMYEARWDVPQFVLGSYPFLKVNKEGKRFFNESTPYQFAMNSLMHQPDHLEAMIWNEDTMNHLAQFHTLGCSRLGWPGIFDTEGEKKSLADSLKNNIAQKADSLEELAKKMHLPKDNLVATVKKYNEYCKQGIDKEFGKEKSRLYPVDGGPYYGIWLSGNLLATLDGLHINDHMQVLRRNNKPIKGLYAAGNCSGGFFWGSYEDRVPGLTCSHAQTFGRLAGQYVLSD